MAVPAQTFTTYGAVGEREDLTDIIYDISPMDTPFLSNASRESATAVFYEWQTDSLDTAAVNAQLEGDDGVTSTSSATTRLGNYTQISTKVPRVTGTLRAVATAGRADELAYQISKRGRELKRDMETALTGTQAASAGGAGTARNLAGIGAWLSTNQVQKGANATTPPVSSGAPSTDPTAGTAATFVEADLKSVVKQCWDNGGDPGVIMTGSFNKQAASGFAGIGTQFRDVQPSGPVSPGSIVGAADIYISDFGQHQIVANRFMPAANVYALDMEYWCVAYLRPIQTEDLGKTGDSDRRMLISEYTLGSKNEAASGKIYTTTTS
ncbi:major capsid protein [uncultured Mediterranean phage uvMED]|nr:putative phage major head protein [uncultured phage MedDCM-OCT-S04-C64]BAQ88893.1 major capsid protein [uncultured Mediterranean phage uvMED]BAQ88904.1 major head protein [uncultured Mediterranean phage uvMED]BAQ88953.1 major head protein [uncultured Mediterranean phage uvMED]BAQ89133.1 major head protein [uncultured Mediterranean phage uvMED]